MGPCGPGVPTAWMVVSIGVDGSHMTVMQTERLATAAWRAASVTLDGSRCYVDGLPADRPRMVDVVQDTSALLVAC